MLAKRIYKSDFSRDKFYCRQGSTMYDKKVLSKSPFNSRQKNTKLSNLVMTYRG